MSNSDWFSRRHRTAEAHISAQRAKAGRVADSLAIKARHELARAQRSPAQQIASLDAPPERAKAHAKSVPD